MSEQVGNVERLPAICPWCGTEMAMRNNRQYTLINNEYSIFSPATMYWGECETCGAKSPVSSTTRGACLAAQRRPTIKPLRLQESYDEEVPVWFELKNYPEIPPMIVNGVFRNSISFVGEEFELVKYYNVLWRLWERKPTDAEREAAKWDDEA